MARGMVMTRGRWKAIERSRRKQRNTWGGTYSFRGMVAPHHIHSNQTSDATPEEIKLVELKARQDRRGFFGTLGHILRKMVGR